MNCFIRALKLITNKTEDELKILVENVGINYDSLLEKGMRLEYTFPIMSNLGFLFYNNLNLSEKICANNSMFDKGEFVFIYMTHALACVNRQYSDEGNINLHRYMYGFYYRPTKLNVSIKDKIAQIVQSSQFDYVGHGQNRVVFKVANNKLAKIAITDAGREENLHDLLHSSDKYYATCFGGNDAFIIQEELQLDSTKQFATLMTKLAHQRGYDHCQYGVSNNYPKFYDAKISGKNCETFKLQFDETDLDILNEWLTTQTNQSFIEYYRSNAWK